ncbi:MAG: TetR/AcrR family transcriptional regulator [Terracoccus sp.]
MSAPSPLHGRRPYRSPSRDAAARLTRQRIIDAAEDLFLDSGYVSTSVRSIARAAGVAEKTVYLQFDTKPAILKAVIRTAIGGSDDAVRIARSQWFLEVLAQPRLDRKIELLAEATSALHERTGLVFAVAREAATVDTEVEALWKRGKRGQLCDMTTIAENFAEYGLIPPPVEVDWVIELLYVLLGPENWYLIRHELGHDEHHYRDWLHTTLDQALAPKQPTQRHPFVAR